MMKKYLFTLFLVLISLALSGAFSYTYSAAGMGAYCQTPPVVSSAVQPNIMIVQDVSGSMAWCGYYSGAGNPNACDTNCTCSQSGLQCASNSDCAGGSDVCGSCGYNASVTYDGYFNPSKSYEKDANGIWEEYTASGTCKPVPSAAKCESQSTYNSSCVLKGSAYGSGAANSAGTSPLACTVITSGSNPCKSPNYCCTTATYQTGQCGSSSGNFLNYMHMHRIDMLRWAMTGGTPATCATKPYTPAYCDVELWQSSTAAGQVGASCTGSVAGTGCCGVNNLLNGDGVTQSGCVLTTDDGLKLKVPWRRINGSCSVGSATNVTPALCANAGGTWTPAGGLAYTFMTLPLIPRMGLLAFEDTGTVDGLYIGDYTSTGNAANDAASVTDPIHLPYMNLITHINSIPPNNGTPTGPAMWDAYNYFEQNAPKYTDSGAAVASFKGLKAQTGSTDHWRNPMYTCGAGGANCLFVPCAGNYVILMSDGGWNAPSCSISGSTSCTTATNADPVVPAYCMHNNFMNTVSSTQTNVTSVYTIALFSSFCSKSGGICQSNSDCTGGSGDTCALGYGGTALENVAMYGSFNNAGGKLWPSNLNGFPGTTCTDSVDCSSTAKGSLCTVMPPSSADWDQKPVDGIPDTAYTASSASQIKSGVLTAVQDILQRSTSGTAVSILASGEGSGANLLQAFFFPQKAFSDAEIAWIGELQNLWYYLDPQLQVSTIREDTVHDYMLELKQDNVVHFRFDTTQNKTVADLYTDTTGTGSPLNFNKTVDLEQTTYLWEAGYMLWNRNLTTSPRTLYTTTDGASFLTNNFSVSNAHTLQNYLQAGSTQEATNLINYISGIDVKYCSLSLNTCASNTDCKGGAGDVCTAYRSRTAALSTTAPNNTDQVWKLGDIISSTPKIQSWVPLNSYASDPPSGYTDQTYYQFTQSMDYEERGTIYTGANDGMLHAFYLGLLGLSNNSDKVSKAQTTDKFLIAQLCEDINPVNGRCDSGETTTADLGTEEWAYIPKNTLPYLRYLADPGYCHLFYVDGTPYLFDASINSTCGGDYSLCVRQTKCLSNPPNGLCDGSHKNLDLANTSWRTVLIGSTGQGGACRQTNTGICSVNVCSQHSATTCTKNSDCPNSASGETCLPACVLAPTTDPANPTNSLGYSSYFALDVTTPGSPSLLWEFSDPGLGFSTSGPAVVRVNGGAPGTIRSGGQFFLPPITTNGKWFVVLASGPTGPIDPASFQFLGSSDQNLKLYILDLKTGTLLRTIDTGLTNAFAGSMVNAAVDTDKWNTGLPGAYEDDVLYIPYSQFSGGKWVGGVLRLTTGGGAGEDSNVGNWNLSTLINGIGPVTTSVSHLQDRTNHNLWLYFGTGRYFYKIGSTIDDATTQQAIYGIQEPCYINDSHPAPLGSVRVKDTLDMACSLKASVSWSIALDPTGSTDSNGNTFAAERVVTNPLAAYTGAVYFTTFEPSASACGFSGNSFLWAVDYQTGGQAATSALQGTALIQVSTGQIQEVALKSAFTDKGGRRTTAFSGVPPKGQGLSVVINPKPMKKILHMQEK